MISGKIYKLIRRLTGNYHKWSWHCPGRSIR